MLSSGNLHQSDSYDCGLFKALANLDYPTSLQPYVSEKITVYLNTVNLRAANRDIKEGIFELLGKVTLPETMLASITDVLLAVINPPHIESPVLIEVACKACARIYQQSNRQQEIVAALLRCVSNIWYQVSDAALETLAQLPNLHMSCAEVEDQITQINAAQLGTLVNLLTQVKIIALTPSFIDTILNKLVFGSEHTVNLEQVARLFKQNLSLVATAALIQNVMRRLQDTPYYSINAHLLSKLPLTRDDALLAIQLILVRIAAGKKTPRSLFDVAMNKLSYGARCSVFAALEGLISVKPDYTYVNVATYLMEMKDKYIEVPMTLKKIVNLPEELNEKIFSYSR